MHVSVVSLSQAWVPWNHVYNFGGFPHFLCQLPPGAQQLSLPSLVLPHMGQLGPDHIHIKSFSQKRTERQTACQLDKQISLGRYERNPTYILKLKFVADGYGDLHPTRSLIITFVIQGRLETGIVPTRLVACRCCFRRRCYRCFFCQLPCVIVALKKS